MGFLNVKSIFRTSIYLIMVNLGNTDLNQRQGLIFTDSVLKGVMKCTFRSLYYVSENWLMKLEKETFNKGQS